jgi:uncharacterized protein (DUF1778 family)
MAISTPEQRRDRRFQLRFVLNEKQWKQFIDALDRPPREKLRLKRLFTEPHVAKRRTL